MFSRFPMAVTIFKKDRSDGYILLESLVSLGLVSLMLLIYVPFLSAYLQKHEEGKEKIEMMRSLHDASQGDYPIKNSEKSSGHYRFTIDFEAQSIAIKNNDEEMKEKIEIESIKSYRE